MARMVIEIPDELKSVGEAVKALIDEVEQRRRMASGGRAVEYATIEAGLAKCAAAIERAGHQVLLQSLEVNAPRVVIDGKSFARVEISPATYYTRVGGVVVTRSLFREVGCRNAKVVDAVSLRAGVVEDGWLPATARGMAHLLQQGTSRDAATTAAELGVLPYSRSSFERVGHAVGALYVARHVDIEDELAAHAVVPTAACSASVSLDRVSLPMEEPRQRPVGRPRKGAARRPIERNYRMAYCATVTLHDDKGEALHTIRYGRMPQGDVVALCQRLASDVNALRRERPDLKVMLLCDGAPELWNLLRPHLNHGTLGVRPFELIDFWHLLEKLAAAARVIHGEAESVGHLRRWRLSLLNARGASRQILEEIKASGRETTNEECPVHDAITYLTNNDDRMDYATPRREGLPIGSGAVEATCKTLVAVRMKRSGSRWKEPTGAHVLQLRALALSDRWSDGITLTLAPLRRAVRAG